MPQRFVVLMDASPINQPTAWMKAVCQQADLTLIDADEVADVVASLQLGAEFLAQQDADVSKHYLAALDKVAKDKTRIALNSITWLRHGLSGVKAVIASLDQIEPAIAAEVAKSKTKLDPKLVADETKRMKGIIEAAVKAVPKDVLCMVAGTDAQKTASAVSYLKTKR